jgi:tetratricopeptide (TPR) repeat protein
VDPLLQPKLNVQQLQQAFGLYSAGQFAQALALAENLERENSDHPVLLNLMGAIHTAMLNFDAAIAKFEKAIELRPDVPDSYFHLGTTQFEKGDLNAAIANYRRAVELRPAYVEAHNKLCQALDRANRTDELADALADARAHCPGEHPALQLREAELLKRQKDFAAARICLEGSEWRAADVETQEAAAYLLSDLCDRLDDPDAAFGYAEDANRICAAGFPAQRTDRSAYFRLIEELGKAFAAPRIEEWSAGSGNADRPEPVFLVGFPRSGTTLLNTILHSHAGITTTEEVPTVYALESAMREMTGGALDNLAGLDAGQIDALREVYFNELDKHLEAPDKQVLVVDKLPLNLVQAGVIHRVFPRAKFVFAQRHPCDAVLSCYMRSFQMNEGMVNCLDLASAARLYDEVMQLWQQYRDNLDLTVNTVRYESLIEDFDKTVSECLEFLGVDWDDGVRNYVETAQSSAQISTPSYDQVTQALYKEASGRWQRYRDHLEPVLPVLQPWAERMGYS